MRRQMSGMVQMFFFKRLFGIPTYTPNYVLYNEGITVQRKDSWYETYECERIQEEKHNTERKESEGSRWQSRKQNALFNLGSQEWKWAKIFGYGL